MVELSVSDRTHFWRGLDFTFLLKHSRRFEQPDFASWLRPCGTAALGAYFRSLGTDVDHTLLLGRATVLTHGASVFGRRMACTQTAAGTRR
jgi:hypothetical protein